ncbi:MAG: 16S rRNA (guanine(527)-N(7))-methyltransferase RsmG [Ilumatobacteraceae bacterium]
MTQAEAFAAAIPASARRVVDVGSGGGLPGLVLIEARPDLHVTLVDRRERSCDFLRRAVRALGAEARVGVVHADLETLGHDVAWRGCYDAATARGVAPPAEVAELVLPLVRPGGVLVVSVAGTGELWPDSGLGVLEAVVEERSTGLVVIRAGTCPDRFPRRRRHPDLFSLHHSG